MNQTYLTILRSLALLGAITVASAAEPQWVEGRHYALIQPAQATAVPAGKVEVVEVFSYGCPACNQFLPVMAQLEARLPAKAQIVYVPASWNPRESWPLFQRAFHTAQVLGIAERTHLAMFDAIWKTGELAVVDPTTHRLMVPQPTMGLVARFYAREAGVTQKAVLDTSKSFEVDLKMMQSDQLVKAYGADQTPTLIVGGKYRVNTPSVRSIDELIALVLYLVERD